MSALYYPYRRLYHGVQHVYSLLPGSGGSFMELVISRPTYVSPVEVPDMLRVIMAIGLR
ncbi:hypothetical protein CsSME_00042028 [Camellia sinensis var. sinensis]